MPDYNRITPYVRNALDLNRVANGIVEDAQRLYVDAAQDILRQFADTTGKTEDKMAWLNAQAGQIRDTLATANNKAYDQVIGDLTKVLKQQTKFHTDQLKKDTKGADVSVRTVQVGRSYVEALAEGKAEIDVKAKADTIKRTLPRILPDEEKPLQQIWGNLLNNNYDNLTKGIRSGLLLGKTTDQIVKDLLQGNRIPKGSPLKKSERALRATVQSAVIGVSTEAQLNVIAANTDITEKYEFLATLDSRTTILCASNDSKVFRYDDTSAPRPPLHWNCRSNIISYLGDFYKKNGIEPPESSRASVNGQVDRDETYESWLRKQPEAFQNEALGKNRADLFRKGVGLAQMVREDNKNIQLSEIDPAKEKEKLEKRFNELLDERTNLLNQQGNPDEQRLAEIKQEMNDIRAKHKKLEKELTPAGRIDEIYKQINDLLSERTRLLTDPDYVKSIGGESVAKRRLEEIKKEKADLAQEGRTLKSKLESTKPKEPTKEEKDLKAFQATAKKGEELINQAKGRLSKKDLEFLDVFEKISAAHQEVEQVDAALRMKTYSRNEDESRKASESLKILQEERLKTKQLYEKLAEKGTALRQKIYDSAIRQIRKESGLTKKEADKLARKIKNDSPVKEAIDWASDLFRLAGGKVGGLDRFFLAKDNRASAYPGLKEISLAPGDGKTSVFHEMGHFVEINGKYVNQSVAFIKKRAIGEPRLLAEMTGVADYGDETAWPDKFVSPYVGKTYYGFGGYAGTEVVSMGLQHIADADQFFHLLNNDPEHLYFVLGILRD